MLTYFVREHFKIVIKEEQTTESTKGTFGWRYLSPGSGTGLNVKGTQPTHNNAEF